MGLVWHLVFLLESLQMGTLQPEAAESRLKRNVFLHVKYELFELLTIYCSKSLHITFPN